MTSIDRRAEPLRRAAPVLALLALTVLAFANTTGSGFVYDDNAIVAANPLVKSLGNLARIFASNYWGPHNTDSGLYRPLAVASFAVDHAVWGLNAAAFHAVNLAWHALASVLAYLLLAAVLGRPRLAWMAAAIFAVHPLHVEAVSGIVGRSELMAACFVLLGALAHVRYRRRGGGRLLAAGAAAYALALLSKETAVLFPLLLLALDAGFDLRGDGRPVVRSEPRWLRAYAAYGAALAGVLLLRFLVLGPHQAAGPAVVSLMDNPLYELPPLPRLLSAFLVLARYLLLMVFPRRLSADYSYDQIPAVLGFGDPRAWLALAVFAFFLWIAVRSFRRNHAVFLALSLFWVPFLPVSNLIVPIGTIMAERVAYLPLLGFAVAPALAFDLALRRPRLGIAAVAAAAVLLAGLTARTVVRNRDWRDDVTLFTAALDVVPRSSRMRLYLGRHHITAGEYETGLAHLEESLAILPGNPETVAEMGHGRIGLGELEEAEARFREAIRYNPDEVGAYFGLGRIYRQQGRYRQALIELQRCVDLVPLHIDARVDLGAVHYALGDFAAARGIFEAVLALDPSSIASAYYLGMMDRAEGNLGAWRERFERTARDAEPHDVSGYNYLALIHEELDELDRAYADLVLARSLNPHSALTGSNLARHYVLRGALAEAVEEAEGVLAANPHSVEALQVVGFAQMLRGRFAEAESALVRAEAARPGDPRTSLHLARLHLAAGRPAEAERRLAEAARFRPEDPELLLLRAGYEKGRGRTDAARDLYARVRRIHPEPPLVDVERARLEAAAGDTAAALRLLAGVEQEVHGPETDFRLGLAHAELGRFEAADDALARALRSQPRNGRFLQERATVLLQRGRAAEAESLLAVLVELQPRHADGLNALAWTLLVRPEAGPGRIERALELSERAVAADSLRASYHDTRAEALHRLGRAEEARAAWREAARLDPAAYGRKARER